ncbi:hypothetical protein KY284_016523 [Solanum tuberosum]|nr:hypothetical protein KY284_016523 [Solanum tuberosum]
MIHLLKSLRRHIKRKRRGRRRRKTIPKWQVRPVIEADKAPALAPTTHDIASKDQAGPSHRATGDACTTLTNRFDMLGLIRGEILGNKIDIFGCLETRVKENKAHQVLKKVGRYWNYCYNYPHGVNGKVWLLWKKHLDVQILHIHEQFIHCVVDNVAASISVLLTIVYARNEQSQREVLWKELQGMGANIQCPWILSGDFNNVLANEERIGLPVTQAEIVGFKEMVNTLQLTALRTKGCFFTWCNKQQATSRGQGFQIIPRPLYNVNKGLLCMQSHSNSI